MRQMTTDGSENPNRTKQKLLSLKVLDLQKIYSGHGLPKRTRKAELQAAMTSIINGKCVEATEEVRKSIIEKISSAYRQTFKSPQAQQKLFKIMPNLTSSPKRLTFGENSREIQIPALAGEVKMKALPFYDLLDTLLPPSPLTASSKTASQVKKFEFNLTFDQVKKIHDHRTDLSLAPIYDVQVLMRLCLFDATAEQIDAYPITFDLVVNDRSCQLPNYLPCRPGQIPKRPPKPIDVTKFLKISPSNPNKIEVRWHQEAGKTFAIAGYLVHKRTSMELFERMKGRGIKPSDFTCALIKEKLKADTDNEIATTMLRVSLICPLGKKRMATPCRASTCMHLQCFDAFLYLQMNELHPKWNCPVCDKEILFDNLLIDGYFLNVIRSLDVDTTEVQLHEDGSWTKLEPENAATIKTAASQQIADVEILSSDDENDNNNNNDKADDDRNNNKKFYYAPSEKSIVESQLKKPLMNGDCVDLTLDDD